ncbi:E3 ubiquitin-protein ligase HRD1 [Aspergillus fijiensis CBS 313.89]|uniref:RING-type E3 ubiquitin transferase n=1 Tax=Aspergillus fijiensis CBS 313.89 TaxID=1448319 RepID=A0A8G1RNC4_9EURO|nr:RING finger protein [Aspergillus fijiensis CBS 313.89]RAK76445.1 RING finger protein [Aspergillus fijiensis CBS 313.89]
MRFAVYAGASTALATGVFLKALHQRANFYAACVYLSQSSANLMILMNVCLLAVGFFIFWLQRLLYGPLRPIETEQLYEKAWFAVTETCLAMTIFRGELGGWFLVMFVSLLVGKVWGWIGEGRVEYLEQQPPANPRLFHFRLALSLLISVLFNVFMLSYCVQTVLEQARPDMMVMFGFEFAVLTILSSSTAARYSISLVELYVTHRQLKARLEERRQEIRAARDEALRQQAESAETSTLPGLADENDVNEMELDVPGWEEKGRWIFYLDLLTDFLKLTVYLTFFAILFTFYGLPIHILRDVVVTIRSFGRRIVDFVRYRNATRDMNERYPDASAEEVAREEVCIICREEMTQWHRAGERGEGAQQQGRVSDRLRPKKLPCGHILHFACLRSWLERQQNCPTCRRPVVAPPQPRGHGDAGNRNPGGDAGGQQNQPFGNQPFGRNAPVEGLPRARIYQFGPFRIGFGAGRGDLFRNLQQQIHQGNVPMQQPNDAIAPNARQIGFGLGFGQPPATPTVPNPASSVAHVQNQLQQVEQQILQEISSLRVTAQQLQLVRMLQMELQRLRGLSAESIGSQPGLSSSALSNSVTSTAERHRFVSDHETPAMRAGDSRLPEGLILPEGWSLTPLYSPGQESRPVGNPCVPTTASETIIPPAPPMTENESNNSCSVQETAAVPGPSVPQDLPNWQSASTPAATQTGIESLSQQWTDLASETQADDTERSEREQGSESSSESPSRGKARVATVEDVLDDDEV